MDFRLGDDIERLREEVRSFAAEQVTEPMLEEMERTGTMHNRSFARAMGARGWIAAGWPVEEGGAGFDLLQQSVLIEELTRAKAPIDGVGTTMLVASTIRMWGTPEQKAEVLDGVAK